MKKSISKSGRILVELDGFSGYYNAYVSGSLTGIVSLPAAYADEEDEVLVNIAGLCLNGHDPGDYRRRFDAKVVRKADRIR